MDDNCPICKQPIDIIVSCFSDAPFIDGVRYKHICYVCYSVPNVDDGVNQGHLHNLQDMVNQGFNKKHADLSIKAIKRSIAKHSGKDYSRSAFRYGVIQIPSVDTFGTPTLNDSPEPGQIQEPESEPESESEPEPESETNPLQCPKCDKICSSTSGYTLHTKSCKGRKEASLICPICGYQASSSSGLTLHRKKHEL